MVTLKHLLSTRSSTQSCIRTWVTGNKVFSTVILLPTTNFWNVEEGMAEVQLTLRLNRTRLLNISSLTLDIPPLLQLESEATKAPTSTARLQSVSKSFRKSSIRGGNKKCNSGNRCSRKSQRIARCDSKKSRKGCKKRQSFSKSSANV